MKFSLATALLCASITGAKLNKDSNTKLVEERTEWTWTYDTPHPRHARHLRPVVEKASKSSEQKVNKRAVKPAEPTRSGGYGGVFSGGTNRALDRQNPDNLGAQSTDSGTVVNLKWAFSDSHTRLLSGGWVREQTITDLPASTDMAAAQQHLQKGATRELHWHRAAEWGYVYAGQVLVSAVDDEGRNQITTLNVGDIWYFPKGAPHMIHGLAEQNEYLLVFDEADFDALGTTFMVDDWLLHTPASIVARNFGVNESTFAKLPDTDPYIVPGTPTKYTSVENPYGTIPDKKSFVYKLSEQNIPEVPGGGGTLAVVDSVTNFPIATTLAAAVVTLKPGALRELHWHPNAQEWLYFLSGTARATVFMGSGTSRTFDFRAGDTAVFPDNSGHYVENTSETESLVWIEMYKSDHVAEIPLSQWLAVSPPDIVARTLGVSVDFVKKLPKTKQILLSKEYQAGQRA